jgi:hypothetical protein
MIEPDESAIAVFCVEVWPVARQNMCVQIDFHAQVDKQAGCYQHPLQKNRALTAP